MYYRTLIFRPEVAAIAAADGRRGRPRLRL